MKSFLSGRSRHDQPSLRSDTPAPAGSARVAAAGHHAAHAHGAQGGHKTPGSEPKVECVKQGDKVVGLIITCACGERIEVDCLYPTGG